MGAIIDRVQHSKDCSEVSTLVRSNPVIARHLSHHLRNPLSTILESTYLLAQNPSEVEVKTLTDTIERATHHMIEDLRKVGL